MSEFKPSALQQRIFKAMHEGFETSAEIAQAIVSTPRAVATSLSFARGAGVVNDGSTFYNWPGPGQSGCMHRPAGPIRWSFGEAPEIDGWCPDMLERMERLNAETAEAPDDDEGGHPT